MQQILEIFKATDTLVFYDIIGFLARIAMQKGEILSSVSLLQAALNGSPRNMTLTNNLMDAWEAYNLPDKALELAKAFLQNNLELCVGTVFTKNVLQAWKDGNGCIEVPKNPQRQDTSENKTCPYTDIELELLHFYFKIVKLLYMVGQLTAVQGVIKTIMPAHESGGDLHLTIIRNANSYFNYIQMLVNTPTLMTEEARTEKPPLYVVGDSHSLSLAWREFNLTAGGTHWFKSLLVTGCKIWHLRKESQFYPKVNFYQAIKAVPKGSKAIFILGEIDCREGIVSAVAQSIYPSIEEALKKVIDIYMEVLAQVVSQRRLKRLYVHPAPPVLDITRGIINTFNRMLAERLVAQRTRFPNIPIYWLNIDADLLTDHGASLKEAYQLEGTHLNPAYIALLEKAINRLNESSPN